jgi:glycosyltransferase involved in cell wall biosynthesis
MKLAYVTTVPQTQWQFLRGQNGYMRAQGFEIHAIASPSPWLAKLAARDGVQPHAVAMSRRFSPLRDCVSLVRLFLLLRRIAPDIVQVSTPKAALLGAIAATAARIPVRVFLARGTLTASATGLKRTIVRWLERLTAALCHQTIAVSPSLLAFLRAERIVPPDGGLVLMNGMSNGIDARRFQLASPGQLPPPQLPHPLLEAARDQRAVIVGYVGRLGQDKGIEQLAQAWESVRAEFPKAHLLLVGPWEDDRPVPLRWRDALTADPRVHLPGRVDDVVPYYRVMSLCVFPSYREGFPNVPMEAAAMGLPVVATRVVGCVDAVGDGCTGTLVPPRDAAGLAAAIARYLRDPELRRRHGEAGRARVLRDFGQEPIWEALAAEYRRLLYARGCVERPQALVSEVS